jgi:hypothetical protein
MRRGPPARSATAVNRPQVEADAGRVAREDEVVAESLEVAVATPHVRNGS